MNQTTIQAKWPTAGEGVSRTQERFAVNSACRTAQAVILTVLLAGCAPTLSSIYDMGEVRTPREIECALNSLTRIAGRAKYEPSRRCHAIKVLARIGDRRIVGTLGGLAGSGKEPTDVRRWAVWGLGETGRPAAIPQLNSALRQEANEQTASWGLEALVKLAIPIQLNPDATRDTMRTINDLQARFPNSESICHLSTLLFTELRSLTVLIELLKESRDKGEDTRTFNLVRWIGDLMIEQSQQLDRTLYAQAVEELKLLASYPCKPVRYRALWYLGRVRDARAWDTLIETCRSKDDPATRLLAYWAASRVNRKRFKSTFRKMSEALLQHNAQVWLRATATARALKEPDLELQRFIADVHRQ